MGYKQQLIGMYFGSIFGYLLITFGFLGGELNPLTIFHTNNIFIKIYIVLFILGLLGLLLITIMIFSVPADQVCPNCKQNFRDEFFHKKGLGGYCRTHGPIHRVCWTHSGGLCEACKEKEESTKEIYGDFDLYNRGL